MENGQALLQVSRQSWFYQGGQKVTPEQRAYVRSLLEKFANNCEDFRKAISLLEEIETIAADKGIKDDFRKAGNYLKRRWNEKDPRSTFEIHRSWRGKRDNIGPLYYGGLFIVAVILMFFTVQILIKISGSYLPSVATSPVTTNPMTGQALAENERLTSQTPSVSGSAIDATASVPDSLERSEEVFRAVSPSIVIIRTRGQRNNQGSGVAVGKGIVVTNRHVIQGASQYFVEYQGTKYPASVAYADPEYDLCALNAPGLPALPSPVASFKSLRIGQRVYAIGAPNGLELSISDGVVSGVRDFGAFPVIQTNAPISPGSSGGGLFDTSGRLVGITTATLLGGQQINIAIVADLISMLPARSTGASIESLPPVSNPQTANDIVDRPWKDALKQAKSAIIQTEADWKGCSASVQALNESRNALITRMNGLMAGRRIAEYNALVPEENRQAAEIRQWQSECDLKHQIYVSAVNRHNEIVRQYRNK